HIKPPPSATPTLSLHDALPIFSADGDTRTSTVSVAPPAGLPEQVRVSATTQVVSGPDYGTYGLHCFYNDDGDNVTYYSATVRVDGSAAQIRRHGGEQGSTHLEEVTAKPVSGFLTPSRDAEEAPVNTFDFTCELDPEADTVTLNLWLRSEEHTSELQSRENLVCRLLLEKK